MSDNTWARMTLLSAEPPAARMDYHNEHDSLEKGVSMGSSLLLTDVGGPSPLWAPPFPRRVIVG